MKIHSAHCAGLPSTSEIVPQPQHNSCGPMNPPSLPHKRGVRDLATEWFLLSRLLPIVWGWTWNNLATITLPRPVHGVALLIIHQTDSPSLLPLSRAAHSNLIVFFPQPLLSPLLPLGFICLRTRSLLGLEHRRS